MHNDHPIGPTERHGPCLANQKPTSNIFKSGLKTKTPPNLSSKQRDATTYVGNREIHLHQRNWAVYLEERREITRSKRHRRASDKKQKGTSTLGQQRKKPHEETTRGQETNNQNYDYKAIVTLPTATATRRNNRKKRIKMETTLSNSHKASDVQEGNVTRSKIDITFYPNNKSFSISFRLFFLSYGTQEVVFILVRLIESRHDLR